MKKNPSPSRIVYQGPFFQLREHREVRDGGGEKKRFVLEHPGAAAAVPLLPGRRVVMVEQFRKAVEQRTLEIPAGKLEKGETPEECLKRELIEETGYRAGKLEHLASFHPSFGISNEVIHIYLARGLKKALAQDGDEDGLRTIVLPLPEVERLIAAGQITDAKTIIGIAAAVRRLGKRPRREGKNQ